MLSATNLREVKRRLSIELFLVCIVAACGGGGGTSPVPGPPSATPSTTPASTPTPLPTANSQKISLGAAPAVVTFATIAPGVFGTVTFPAAVSAATATTVLQRNLPANVPTPSIARRADFLGAAVTALAYITLTPTGTISFAASPAVSLTFPSGTLAGNLYLVGYNPSNTAAGWFIIDGPIPASGNVASFPSVPLTPAITIVAGSTFVYAVVQTGSSATLPPSTSMPTPTATPTPTPSPTPTPAPTATPNPNITQYQLTVTPGAIAAGPDGALWFTISTTNAIGRISTSGAVSQFPLPNSPPAGYTQNGPAGLVAGPDGAIWFTTSQYNPDVGIAGTYVGQIGRMTTAGVVTEFTAPSPANIPNSITVGPDGALWFTAVSATNCYEAGCQGAIGRVTTAGAFTVYTVPTCGPPESGVSHCDLPGAIAAGPDGALWYTFVGQNPQGAGPNSVGRSTTSGALTAYGDGTTIAGGITAGPDGNMWYVLAGVSGGYGNIARITTSGAITQYQTQVLSPTGPIVSAPDGALWYAANFTPGGPPVIGRITTAGVSTYIALPSGGSAASMAVGSDGAIWFTEPGLNSIARLPVSAQTQLRHR